MQTPPLRLVCCCCCCRCCYYPPVRVSSKSPAWRLSLPLRPCPRNDLFFYIRTHVHHNWLLAMSIERLDRPETTSSSSCGPPYTVELRQSVARIGTDWVGLSSDQLGLGTNAMQITSTYCSISLSLSLILAL